MLLKIQNCRPTKYIASLRVPARRLSVLYFGSDNFSKSCLSCLYENSRNADRKCVTRLGVVCLPEKVQFLPVKNYAIENDIPLSIWPNLPDISYDIGVVVSFGKLIPAPVINRFKFGIINVHGSLLPRWRGASPLAHAIMTNDKKTGITIMEICPGRFDHGKVLNVSETVEIQPQWTAEDLGNALEKEAGKTLIETLNNIEFYLANMKKQCQEGVTYAPKINANHTMITWDSSTAEQIYRRYLAYGYRKNLMLRTTYLGQLLKLQKFSLPTKEHLARLTSHETGCITFDKKTKLIFVKCKNSFIGVSYLTYKGKLLTAQDFFNGFMQTRLKKGEIIKFE